MLVLQKFVSKAKPMEDFVTRVLVYFVRMCTASTVEKTDMFR